MTSPISARYPLCIVSLIASLCGTPAHAQGQAAKLAIEMTGGQYVIRAGGLAEPVLRAHPAFRIDGRWLRPKDFPNCAASTQPPADGSHGQTEILRCSGRPDAPDLILTITTSAERPWGEIKLSAQNATTRTFHVQAFRLIEAEGPELLNLGGHPAADRILNDSFSEDRPAMKIHDLSDSEKGVHRAVGSQLLFNQESHYSWFIGALSSDKFLTVLRLHLSDAEHSTTPVGYEVDSTGTTELLKENSLLASPAQDQVELSLALNPGTSLSSETLMFSVSRDYHEQLESYGREVAALHHSRVNLPTPLGWWSWTAFYFGLNEGAALTNAQWLAENLKDAGYRYFHMDEGVQFARGEYATPDAALFPEGLAALEHKVVARGLTPGMWTAPFEVSERSYVYQHHRDWLVHNFKGDPIHIGYVVDGKEQLYALDATNPGAQNYLRATYTTLARDWGIHYIKMDFLEDSAVEGAYFVPGTTALEAQRIGIRTIREAVGENTVLDKDGGELLNPVGLVDTGRISQDTGHTFSSSRDAAPGIAARYYMNRNYFIADPDAFSVSRQTVSDQNWHGGQNPLTLEEAKVSIALSAVSGGMFEIGDDLPSLGEDSDRVALVKNRDLLDMARLGRASIPLDLMGYDPKDEQPSIFLLKQDPRESILTLFNWTESSRTHALTAAQLDLPASGAYQITELLAPAGQAHPMAGTFRVTQPPHSVRMYRLTDVHQHVTQPEVTLSVPSAAKAGETLSLASIAASASGPVLAVSWQFGDGTTSDGFKVEHTYTHAGTYTVKCHSVGLAGRTAEQSASITVTGSISTSFRPEKKVRLVEPAASTKPE